METLKKVRRLLKCWARLRSGLCLWWMVDRFNVHNFSILPNPSLTQEQTPHHSLCRSWHYLSPTHPPQMPITGLLSSYTRHLVSVVTVSPPPTLGDADQSASISTYERVEKLCNFLWLFTSKIKKILIDHINWTLILRRYFTNHFASVPSCKASLGIG